MHRTDPVLALAVDNISKIDTVDCERLSSLWNVFTKCAENLENGRRLENLSWRLWYREYSSRSRHHKRQKRSSTIELPALSNSVESATSDDLEAVALSKPEYLSSKGQHLTPNRFHELVTQFGQEQPQYKEWTMKSGVPKISRASQSSGATKFPCQATECSPYDSHNTTPRSCSIVLPPGGERLASTREQHLQSSQRTAACEVPPQALRRASSVVHGFNPSCASIKQSTMVKKSRSQEPMHDPTPHSLIKGAAKSMFFIESSPSESEQDDGRTNSTRNKRELVLKQPKKTGLISPVMLEAPAPVAKKHTSFREIVDEGSDYESSPFDSDDESETEDCHPSNNESAILSDTEDDPTNEHETCLVENDDDWDSVCSESRPNSPQNSNRFDKLASSSSRPSLVSRKSMLSTLLTASTGKCTTSKLANAQSKSSPVISKSRKTSPIETPALQLSAQNEQLRQTDLESGQTLPQSIKGSLSPRSTRRNMLASELSESLRRHLLWERKQKSGMNGNADAQTVLQRRHTAYDLKNVQAHPQACVSYDHTTSLVGHASDNEFGYNGAGW